MSQRTEANYTPLHIAIRHANVELLGDLLDSGDYNKRNNEGRTAIHYLPWIRLKPNLVAALETIKIAGIDITAMDPQDRDGFTLGHICLEKNNIELVKLLINYGYKFNQRTTSQNIGGYRGTMISAYPLAYAYALFRDRQERKHKQKNNNNDGLLDGPRDFDHILKVFSENCRRLDVTSIQFCKISTLEGWTPVFDVFTDMAPSRNYSPVTD